MTIYRSVFHKENKAFRVFGWLYLTLCVGGVVASITMGTTTAIYAFCLWCVLMFLRSQYYIYESVIFDPANDTISLKILKKSVKISQITAIKRVRAGQLRLITSDGKQLPVSVAKDAEFTKELLNLNPNIVVQIQ